MNCPAWEERILLHLEGQPDEGAAEHLRECAGCAAFARELGEDAAVLRAAPPEIETVDYAAVRRAAARQARLIRGRRSVVAVLAVAAAILLAARVAMHRDLAQTPHPTPIAPPEPAGIARVEPPAAPPSPVPHVVRHARPRGLSQAEVDRRFAQFLEVQDEQRHREPADLPRATVIATAHSDVRILLLPESKGDDRE